MEIKNWKNNENKIFNEKLNAINKDINNKDRDYNFDDEIKIDKFSDLYYSNYDDKLLTKNNLLSNNITDKYYESELKIGIFL